MTKSIIFVLLASTTILCHTYVERYEKNGLQLLTQDWKSAASPGGLAKISDDQFFLTSQMSGKHVQIQQNVTGFKPGDILMLSAYMKYTGVIPGEKSWNRARLLLVQNNGLKDQWGVPHSVGAFAGTQDWKQYSKVLNIDEGTTALRVTAQLSRCTGSFWLKNLQLYTVKQAVVYTWVQRAILVSWGLFAFYFLSSCLSSGNGMIVLKVLLMAFFVVIIIGTTMPQEVRNKISHEVSSQIQKTDNVFKPGFSIDPAKSGHFLFFTLFGGALFLLKGKDSLWGVVFNLLLLAGGTELAQFFIDGRSPLITDFYIDMAGGTLGITLSNIILKKN